MPLSALSPFGPIFGKELRTTARRKRTYFLRVAYLGGLFLLLLLTYTSTRPNQSYSVAYRQQQQAEMGYAFFCAFSMFCVISMALIGPVLTATAISSEREHKTLHVLLMTPINSWQIISGKLFSRLLAALTLIGLSLPALAVARLLGGVELNQMFAVICICTVTALSSAAIGLFYSTFMTRAYAVILLSYATQAFIYLFVPFLIMTTAAANSQHHRGPPMGALQAITVICPPSCVAMLLAPQQFFAGFYWWPCVAFALGLTALLVMLCGVVLRRIARRAGEANVAATPPPLMPPPVLPLASLAAPPAPPMLGMPEFPDVQAMSLPPLEETSAAPPAPQALQYASGPMTRTIGDNPVLWREVRRPLMARRWQAIVGGIACVGLLVTSYIALSAVDSHALKERDLQIGYAVIFNAVLMLLVCVISATAISGEKERDTWTLLLATPLTAGQIVRGKFLGLLRRMVGLWALIVLHFGVFTLAGVISEPTFVVTLWIMFSFNMIWVVTGLYLSLRLKHTTFAVILNLSLPVIAYVLVTLLLALMGEMADHNGNWADFVGWYAPYPYLIHGIEGLSSPYPYDFWLPYHHQATQEEFEWTVFLVGVIYLAVSFLILRHSIKRFDRIVGRSGNG